MHEMSLMTDLMKRIERVARDNGAQRVLRVKVAIGALAHISADHFREHFEESSRGTLAQGAALDITTHDDIHDPHAQDIRLDSVEVAEP